MSKPPLIGFEGHWQQTWRLSTDVYGMTTHEGRLYATVEQDHSVLVYSLDDGEEIARWDFVGGMFENYMPGAFTSVAADEDQVYVLDRQGLLVVISAASGTILHTWPINEDVDGMVVHEGRLIVVTPTSIEMFSTETGERERTFPHPCEEGGAVDLCVYGERIYLTDSPGQVVHVLDLEGNVISMWSSPEGMEQENKHGLPCAIAALGDHIVVSDIGEPGRLYIYTTEGELVRIVRCSEAEKNFGTPNFLSSDEDRLILLDRSNIHVFT